MEKPAETQVPIHDLLRRRWSPRAYNQRPIEIEKLRSLIEAGMKNRDIHHLQFEQATLSTKSRQLVVGAHYWNSLLSVAKR